MKYVDVYIEPKWNLWLFKMIFFFPAHGSSNPIPRPLFWPPHPYFPYHYMLHWHVGTWNHEVSMLTYLLACLLSDISLKESIPIHSEGGVWMSESMSMAMHPIADKTFQSTSQTSASLRCFRKGLATQNLTFFQRINFPENHSLLADHFKSV